MKKYYEAKNRCYSNVLFSSLHIPIWQQPANIYVYLLYGGVQQHNVHKETLKALIG